MADCAACGRRLDEGASFCTACGQRVPTAHTRAPALAGRVQEPWVVVVLTIVTLQVYLYVWAWRVSREVDAWRGAGDAHAAVRRGVLLGSVGGILFLAAFLGVVGLGGLWIEPAPGLEGPPTDDPFSGLPTEALVLLVGGILGGGMLMVAGGVWFFVGLWRVWRALEEERRRRGGRGFSPVLMLVLTLLPYVNLVGGPYAQYRTQKELNEIWAATPAPVVPAPWRG